MLPVLDQLLATFFELLKNMYLTWIASVDKNVVDFRKLGVVDSAKFAYSRRFAPLPCTVYLVESIVLSVPQKIIILHIFRYSRYRY